MLRKEDKNKARYKRHLRVRSHISGTPECPRLNVFRSLGNIYIIERIKVYKSIIPARFGCNGLGNTVNMQRDRKSVV